MVEGSGFFSHGTPFSEGVAVLFKAAANINFLSSTDIVKGRLLIVRAEIEGFVFCFVNIYAVFCFVNIYAPNRGTERESFFTLLSNELKNTHHDQLIVGGDFHCTLVFSIDRISGEPHPQSSRSLSNVIIHHDLIDAWRIKHPQTRQYTWVRVRKNQVLDWAGSIFPKN